MNKKGFVPPINNNNNQNKERAGGDKYFVNHQIRAERVMVIDNQGQSLGVLPRYQALARAEETGLDLVQVGEKDGVPITKMMDYGKFLYARKKQLSDAKKHQKVVLIKEIKIRPNIGEQDYKTKLNQAFGFFEDGHKVKFTLQFRGREATMLEDLGPKLFKRILDDLTARNVGTLVEEKDGRSGMFWSKIFYVKSNK